MTQETRRIFISYSKNGPADELANKVASYFQENGHYVFIDTKIGLGNNWSDTIEEALANVDFFIVFLCSKSVSSDYVTKEVEMASELKKNTSRPVIIPVRVKMTDTDTLPFRMGAKLDSIQYVRWSGESDTERVIDELASRIVENKEPTPYIPSPRDERKKSGINPSKIIAIAFVLLIAFSGIFYALKWGFLKPETAGKILSPVDSTEVDSEFTLSGTLQGVPSGHTVWLAVQIDDLRWIKESNISRKDKKWTARITMYEGSGQEFIVQLLAVDEYGSEQISTWLEENEKKRSWPGLSYIAGSTVLDYASLTLK